MKNARKHALSQIMPEDGWSQKALAVQAAKPVLLQHEPSSGPTAENDVVSRLMAIVSQETGLDSAELDPGSHFVDLGIDSLLSLQISGRLQEELGLDVSSASFGDHLTVKDLIERVGGSAVSKSASTVSSVIRTPKNSEHHKDNNANVSSIDEGHIFMETIRMTISEETGTLLEDLTPSTMLSELGIDSLLALTIVGILSERLRVDLPPTLFVDNDNLNDIKNTLGTNGFLPSTPFEVVTSGAASADVLVPIELSQPQLLGPPHASLVRLQGPPKTAKKTLFLFPDGSGSATSYMAFPEISPEIVVYGLNCPWMRTPHELQCSLEQYVAKFLVELRRRQPTGPYHFGGWSAGGILAYEAAQQLARIGEETAKLILIDSPNPIGLENPPQRMYDFFESLNFFGMAGKKPPSWLRPHFDAFLRILDAYKVRPFNSKSPDTHIIYARDGICKHPSHPRPEIRSDDPREMLWLLENRTDFSGSGWKELVGEGKLSISVMDEVNHFSLVAPGPRIAELASFVARAME